MGVEILVLGLNLDSLIVFSTLEERNLLESTLIISKETDKGIWYSDVTGRSCAAFESFKDVAVPCSVFKESNSPVLKNLHYKIRGLDPEVSLTPNLINNVSKALNLNLQLPLLCVKGSDGDFVPIFGVYAILAYFHACKFGNHQISAADACVLNSALSIGDTCDLNDLETCLKEESFFDISLVAPLMWYNLVGKINNKTPRLQALLNGYSSSCLRSFSVNIKCKELRNDIFKGEVAKPFYGTTAISYTNGLPHVGHTYEIILLDVICRYRRLFGNNVRLVTGTDEHGIKVANTAAKQNMAPRDLVDYYAGKFRENNNKLLTCVDDFVRTTEKRHILTAQQVWRKIDEKGDIYLGEYCGWYNEREETFVSETDAAATNYCDPLSGKPYLVMKEASYFFKMGKYQQRLIEYIKTNPGFIRPEARRNEILTRLQEPLEDLSISRTMFDWGIPVPNDPKHVMYVWFDALSNYLTAANFLNDISMWPPEIQVFGKDIAWFHTVIFPCMLMSLELEIPKVSFSHGFIVAADGRKMSKSLGNVLNIEDLMKTFGPESLRYYLMRDSIFGSDVKFDPLALRDLHNADLADTIGNLVHRITTLCQKFCNGLVPNVIIGDNQKPFDSQLVLETIKNAVDDYNLQLAVTTTIDAFRQVNRYLTDAAPWASDKTLEYKQVVIRIILESIYVLAHLMQPTIPNSSSIIFRKLNTRPKSHLGMLSLDFDNLEPGTKIDIGVILFTKVQG
ncbi:bifunctional Methioninyl-tRNA synthetase core domain/Methionyl-tRNA synthetase [Babesia duncani]|uniref:methionine--tRNA ligase n=1 Tax=Babesia duncani TaxID=323732 RepID=A0AAD9UQ23_9APIC|nr:bifunctional Methioninyl-tRNA synthetase core domain/Methionyl-tRNA synthetase [Babesia duncani]